MEIKRKIISGAVQRLIGQFSLDDLTAIYKAEQNSHHASAQLGINAQIAAQDSAQTLIREIVAGLSDYKIDRMESNIKTSARDLARYKAEVTA
jgi:hypothetical protein